MTLFFLHYGKQRRNVIIIGGVILAIGLIGMIATGSIVIQDTANNNLTSQGYPATQVLGISVYSFEYASVFLIIFGIFLFSRGLIAMDSIEKTKTKIKNLINLFFLIIFFVF